MKAKLLLALLAITLTGTAAAQMKPEDAIKWRQSAYASMGWSMFRIKSNVEGTYNKEEVIKAANVIQAIANSGMGALRRVRAGGCDFCRHHRGGERRWRRSLARRAART